MQAKRLLKSIMLCVGWWGVQAGEAEALTMIQNKGSDTMFNVAQAWSEAYKKAHPKVAVVVTGGGSGTGIADIIMGTVDLANTSRKMLDKEVEAAQKRGIAPREQVVGYDALAIYVHHANPLSSITLKQLAEIFGEGGAVRKWSQLGVTLPECQKDEMVLVNRQNNSGSYLYFQGAVFGGERDFRLGTMDMHGSKEVVSLVGQTPCAIGYSSLAYTTGALKKVPIARDDRTPPVEVSLANVINRSYPIWRPLFMYSKGEPQGEVKRYLDWIQSDQGQCILLKKGFAPLRDLKCTKSSVSSR
ncbi:MAG: phosphate ABC transporter substrate-binding protein [Magnetococcales bacterium]|nr:phosphate ABC transporter substrate-binding protein [Magnetococcales bacterium]